MRLVTRSDFDGLACAALLEELGIVNEYLYTHPKDVQDGKIEITSNDVLANVPFVSPMLAGRFRLADITEKDERSLCPTCQPNRLGARLGRRQIVDWSRLPDRTK